MREREKKEDWKCYEFFFFWYFPKQINKKSKGNCFY